MSTRFTRLRRRRRRPEIPPSSPWPTRAARARSANTADQLRPPRPRAPADQTAGRRRDAELLPRLLRAWELTGIAVPEPIDELIRDLCRTRPDAVGGLRRAGFHAQRLVPPLERPARQPGQSANYQPGSYRPPNPLARGSAALQTAAAVQPVIRNRTPLSAPESPTYAPPRKEHFAVQSSRFPHGHPRAKSVRASPQ